MQPRILLIGFAVLAAFLITGGYLLFRKRTLEEKLATYQKEVAPKGGVVFQTVLHDRPAAFLLQDCQVYLLDASGRSIQRKKVLKPGFYPWFTVCTGQSIRAEEGYVLVHLSNQAIGAGGGNISGGSYRSKDGIHWEKHTNAGWLSTADGG